MAAFTTTLPAESSAADFDAAAGDSLTLPGQPAYDFEGRLITDPAFADCAVPNSPTMALAWGYGQLDALCEMVTREWFVFTPENVADCIQHVMAGMAARR